MSLEIKGSMTIGALCALAAGAIVPMGVQLTAQVNGALALKASLTISPPTILLAAEAAATSAIALQALITAGVEFPPPTLQIAAVADLIASLQLTASLLGTLAELFAQAGVEVFAYDGPANGLGPALAAALPAPTQEFAIVLSAGADAGVKAALLSFFGGAA